jgi:transcriptional regulator with XRE-family HTH domain
MSSGPKSESTSLAEKINRLFETMHAAGRGPLTNDEVADAIRARGGSTISGQYLWTLRKGRRDNPTRQHIQALAEYFHVPVGYFFDNDLADAYDADLEAIAALRDDDIREIAVRAAKLTPAGRRAVLTLIDSTQHLHDAEST